MLVASVAFIAVGACFFIGSIIIFNTRKQTGDPIYIDTSGISTNDPKNYIDIWRGKTLNIKINDKFDIIIGDMPFIFAIRHLERIASIYTSLNESRKLETSQKTKDIILLKVYDILVNELYKICFQFSKKKVGLRRAIYERGLNDIIWLLSTCEEITDYWRVIEKKFQLLGRGETLKETAGAMFTWDSLKVDEQGKILIVG